MKKLVLSVALVLASMLQLSAQEVYKNAENSEYVFTKKALLDANPVLDQGRSGTCWSFSALSFFESELIRKGMKTAPVLSEMYVVRKAYEAKATKFIRMDGKSNFSEGGAFHDIPYVIKNYGIVPMEAYKGLNYGSEKHNHAEMFSVLDGALNGVMASAKSSRSAGLSPAWKPAISGILDAYFGTDVKEFTYEGKKYTPKSYAESLKINVDDYVSITSFTNHELNKTCQLEIADNWVGEISYNVELEDLFKVAEQALLNGYTIAWGADVSEKGFNFREGLAIVPEDPASIEVKGADNKNFSDAGAEKKSNAFVTPGKELKITPELRQAAYDNKTTTDDHGMHITGLFTDQNGAKYFLVKNSWGTTNFNKGYFYVSEAYFKYKTINIYLHKDGVPKDIKKKLAI